MATTYIYGLKCPFTGEIRYIGKAENPKVRLIRHIGAAKRFEYAHHTARWIRKIIKQDLLPEVVILEEVQPPVRWQDVERRWIALARESGWPLTNSTAGGEGLDYIDPVAEAAYLKNLSASMKELWNRPERKEEARRRSLDAWADPEVTARRIASLTAVANDPAVKSKVDAARLVNLARPEVKAKKSKATKALWQTEEYRTPIIAARNDPEFIAAQSERLTERWQDPDQRTTLIETRWTPEKRAEQAARVVSPERKAAISAARTPESRARQAETLRATWARRKAEAGAAKP